MTYNLHQTNICKPSCIYIYMLRLVTNIGFIDLSSNLVLMCFDNFELFGVCASDLIGDHIVCVFVVSVYVGLSTHGCIPEWLNI